MYLLDVRVDNVTLEEAKSKVLEFLKAGQHKIFTPNPEIIVKARQDKYFMNVLNESDLNLCDGKGIELATKIKRIPGADFILEICKIAETAGKSVYLLGTGRDRVVKKAGDKLQNIFPKLIIAGSHPGPNIVENFSAPDINARYNNNVLEEIRACSPDILFVAFGMGKQEKWISENLFRLPSVRIAMGVGGAFDFISGRIKRAPCWMRKIGLEWIYRLVQEPKRFGRIINATVVFTWLVMKSKLGKNK